MALTSSRLGTGFLASSPTRNAVTGSSRPVANDRHSSTASGRRGASAPSSYFSMTQRERIVSSSAAGESAQKMNAA